MKKTCILALLLLFIAGNAFGQLISIDTPISDEKPAGTLPASPSMSQKPGDFLFGVGAGLCYNATPLSGTAFDAVIILFNFRAGLRLDAGFAISEDFSVGLETGICYFSFVTVIAGNTLSLSVFDLPVALKYTIRSGAFACEGFAGLLISGGFATIDTLNPADFLFNYYAGLRLSLEGIYVEGSYVVDFLDRLDFPRFGAGYFLRIK